MIIVDGESAFEIQNDLERYQPNKCRINWQKILSELDTNGVFVAVKSKNIDIYEKYLSDSGFDTVIVNNPDMVNISLAYLLGKFEDKIVFTHDNNLHRLCKELDILVCCIEHQSNFKPDIVIPLDFVDGYTPLPKQRSTLRLF